MQYLKIGLAPEDRIQEPEVQLGRRLTSITESFQERAQGRYVDAVRFPDADKSAAPVSDDYDSLHRKVKLPTTASNGLQVNGPTDGPTHLIDKAHSTKDQQDVAIITQANAMLERENFLGAEKILGRQLTTNEIINRQLGTPDRFAQAKSGQLILPMRNNEIKTSPNPANPEPLPNGKEQLVPADPSNDPGSNPQPPEPPVQQEEKEREEKQDDGASDYGEAYFDARRRLAEVDPRFHLGNRQKETKSGQSIWRKQGPIAAMRLLAQTERTITSYQADHPSNYYDLNESSPHEEEIKTEYEDHEPVNVERVRGELAMFNQVATSLVEQGENVGAEIEVFEQSPQQHLYQRENAAYIEIARRLTDANHRITEIIDENPHLASSASYTHIVSLYTELAEVALDRHDASEGDNMTALIRQVRHDRALSQRLLGEINGFITSYEQMQNTVNANGRRPRTQEETPSGVGRQRLENSNIPPIYRPAPRRRQSNVDFLSRPRQYNQRQDGFGLQKFGRFVLHTHKLNNGLFSVAYAHNKKKVTDLPNRKLSIPLTHAVQRLAKGLSVSNTGLTDAEVTFLHKLSQRAQLPTTEDSLPLPPSKQRSDRLMVLMGEIQAGNDGDGVKSELRDLVKRMLAAKQMSRADANVIIRTFI